MVQPNNYKISKRMGCFFMCSDTSCTFYHCSHGYAFYAASYLKGDLKTFFDLIEDVIAQADEIDEKFLQVSIAKGDSL